MAQNINHCGHDRSAISPRNDLPLRNILVRSFMAWETAYRIRKKVKFWDDISMNSFKTLLVTKLVLVPTEIKLRVLYQKLVHCLEEEAV